MYKLLLVSDKEEIRSLYRHYAEWNTLGFEQPAIAENAQQGIDLLGHNRYDCNFFPAQRERGQEVFFVSFPPPGNARHGDRARRRASA